MSTPTIETLTAELDALQARLRALPTTAAAAAQAFDNPKGEAEFVRVQIARLALPDKIAAIEKTLARAVNVRDVAQTKAAYAVAVNRLAGLEEKYVPLVRDFNRNDDLMNSFQTAPSAKARYTLEHQRLLPIMTAMQGEIAAAKRELTAITARAGHLGIDARGIAAWNREAVEAGLLGETG